MLIIAILYLQYFLLLIELYNYVSYIKESQIETRMPSIGQFLGQLKRV